MSTTIPISFRASPLPPFIAWTPQEFADALVARLSIESPTTISFFVSGPTAPTSNVGPWLKNGTTWYVWDLPTASYVPQVVEAQSLKYIFQIGEPDHNFYTFWGKLDGSGKAQSIQYYFNGAWHDVYEDTFALYTTTVGMNTAITSAITSALVPYSTTTQMNTAISAAVAAIPAGKGAFQVYLTAPQNVPVVASGGFSVLPIFNGVGADPDATFSGNKYTCPSNGYYVFNVILQTEANDANMTDLGIITGVLKNAGVAIGGSALQSQMNLQAAATNQLTVGPVLLNAGDTVYVQLDYSATVTGASGFMIGAGGPSGAQFSGWQIRGS